MENKHKYIIRLLQIITIYNAISIGFTVKQIDINKYELTTTDKNAKYIDLMYLINIIVPNISI